MSQHFKTFRRAASDMYPILWRQVRREMASTPYKIMLCLLHLSLLLVTFSAIASVKVADEGLEPMLFFGGMFLFFILPIGSLGGLKEERLGNRADLLLISGLGPRTIVYGHWIAQCSKIVPVVASVIPYLLTVVMISRTNVGEAMQVAGLSLLATCFLLLVGVCVSTIESNVGKGVIVFVLVISVPNVIHELASTQFGTFYEGFLYSLWYLPLVPVLMEIASVTFQLPSQRQLIPVQLGVLYFGFLGFASGALTLDLLLFVVAFLCGAAFMFFEPAYRKSWVNRWKRGGRLFRVFGFLTSGGWPCGAALMLLLTGVGGLVILDASGGTTTFGIFLLMSSTFLLPLGVALRIRPDRSLAFRYTVTQVGFIIFTSMSITFASFVNGGSPGLTLTQFASLLPHAGLLVGIFDNQYGRYGTFFSLVALFPFLLSFLLIYRPLCQRWKVWQQVYANAGRSKDSARVVIPDSAAADAG